MSLQFLNNFRGIAILMVILAHSVASVPANNLFIVKLLNMHLENCTILFVAIAGYFFSILSGNYSYFLFLRNKGCTVLIPYIFISVPAVLFYISKMKMYHHWIDLDWFHGDLGPVGQYIYLMITGAHLGPLWFVPMIIIFYILSPLFIFIQNRSWLFIVAFISLLLAMYVGRPIYNDNALHSSIFFLPAYIFGMLLAQRKWLYESLKHSGWFLGLYAIVISAIYTVIAINSSLDLVIKLLLTVLLLAFCQQHISHKVVWLDLCARLSFFLFFVHGYFSGVFRLSMRHCDVHFNEILSIVVFFILVTLMSILAYVVAKLILKEKTKLLLGA